jgi:hypothetical protein
MLPGKAAREVGGSSRGFIQRRTESRKSSRLCTDIPGFPKREDGWRCLLDFFVYFYCPLQKIDIEIAL